MFFANILIKVNFSDSKPSRPMCHHQIYAMVSTTVLTRVTRKCAIVLRTVRSNEIVTSLMMVVHGGGDA